MTSTDEQQYNTTRFFRQVFLDLKKYGGESSPRGMKIKELEHYTYTVPPGVRFMSFPSRKFNLNYLKTEFLWYLKGDLYDTSIGDHAKIWRGIVHPDGYLNSNYGHYVFTEKGIFWVVAELTKDMDSRRASITILNQEKHLKSDQLDVPCTYALNFRIREGRLNMSVHMRSQDCVFGMGNDLPCFSFIHEMVYTLLLSIYPELKFGLYTHTADSFHIYERHYEMLDKMLHEQVNVVECPKMVPGEPMFMINSLTQGISPLSQFEFSKWLTDKE